MPFVASLNSKKLRSRRGRKLDYLLNRKLRKEWKKSKMRISSSPLMLTKMRMMKMKKVVITIKHHQAKTISLQKWLRKSL